MCTPATEVYEGVVRELSCLPNTGFDAAAIAVIGITLLVLAVVIRMYLNRTEA